MEKYDLNQMFSDSESMTNLHEMVQGFSSYLVSAGTYKQDFIINYGMLQVCRSHYARHQKMGDHSQKQTSLRTSPKVSNSYGPTAQYRRLIITAALQPVATCRQSPCLHKPAIIIITSFSLRRHSHILCLRESQPPFSL